MKFPHLSWPCTVAVHPLGGGPGAVYLAYEPISILLASLLAKTKKK